MNKFNFIQIYADKVEVDTKDQYYLQNESKRKEYYEQV
nr:MAG TPA: hypothetical protein [Caudoviricetes sp.]